MCIIWNKIDILLYLYGCIDVDWQFDLAISQVASGNMMTCELFSFAEDK